MWELLAAQVTDDGLHLLLVHHGQVDLDVGRGAECLPAGRTELVLHLRPVPYLEVLPQTLGLNDLAALDANALSSNNAMLQFLVDPLLHVTPFSSRPTLTFPLSWDSLKCGLSSYLVGNS